MIGVFVVCVITALNLALLISANRRGDRLMVAACLIAVAAAASWLVKNS